MSEEKPARRVDWRAANLRGTQLPGLNLQHADFRGADLREVNFTGSDLSYADFRGANATGANFQYATLYAAKMQGVEAYQADFRNSDLRQCNFGGAYLEGAMMPPHLLMVEPRQEVQTPTDECGKVEFGDSFRQRVAERQEKPVGDGRNQQANGRPSREEQRQQKQEHDRGR
jgi:hypothetical protein